jgi:hypothetical protein
MPRAILAVADTTTRRRRCTAREPIPAGPPDDGSFGTGPGACSHARGMSAGSNPEKRPNDKRWPGTPGTSEGPAGGLAGALMTAARPLETSPPPWTNPALAWRIGTLRGARPARIRCFADGPRASRRRSRARPPQAHLCKTKSCSGPTKATRRGGAAYFSPSWTAFQAERGRHFGVIVDGVSN